MHKLELYIRFISPLFSSNDGDNFKLTPQTLRGILRFWFRAVVPRVLNINRFNDENKNLIGLKKAEEYIFGSTKMRSSFDIVVEEIDIKKGYLSEREKRYQLYGLNKREYAIENSKVKVVIYLKKKDKDIGELIKYLFILVSIVGGIGSKSRKGYGSFEILNQKKYTFEEILNILDDINRRIFSRIKGFDIQPTAFNGTVTEFPTLLEGYYDFFIYDRGFSNLEQVFKFLYENSRVDKKGIYLKVKEKLRKFNGHDSFREAFILINSRDKKIKNKKDKHKKIVFYQSIMGLPINYYVKSLKKTIKLIPTKDTGERKASPLFISIHENEKNKYRLHFLVMRSKLTDNGRPLLNFGEITVLGNQDYKQFLNILKEELYSQG